MHPSSGLMKLYRCVLKYNFSIIKVERTIDPYFNLPSILIELKNGAITTWTWLPEQGGQ